MTVKEKVLMLIKKAGYKKPGAFYKELAAFHEEQVINPRTFYNLVRRGIPPQERTLNQIALFLGIPTTELRKGTDQERLPKSGFFTYDAKATLYTYSIKAPFLPLKLTLKPGGKTIEEYDKPDAKESLKWILVIIGKISVGIRKEGLWDKHSLHKGQTLLFDARNHHYFENESGSTSVVHIIHYPATNSNLHFA